MNFEKVIKYCFIGFLFLVSLGFFSRFLGLGEKRYKLNNRFILGYSREPNVYSIYDKLKMEDTKFLRYEHVKAVGISGGMVCFQLTDDYHKVVWYKFNRIDYNNSFIKLDADSLTPELFEKKFNIKTMTPAEFCKLIAP